MLLFEMLIYAVYESITFNDLRVIDFIALKTVQYEFAIWCKELEGQLSNEQQFILLLSKTDKRLSL